MLVLIHNGTDDHFLPERSTETLNTRLTWRGPRRQDSGDVALLARILSVQQSRRRANVRRRSLCRRSLQYVLRRRWPGWPIKHVRARRAVPDVWLAATAPGNWRASPSATTGMGPASPAHPPRRIFSPYPASLPVFDFPTTRSICRLRKDLFLQPTTAHTYACQSRIVSLSNRTPSRHANHKNKTASLTPVSMQHTRFSKICNQQTLADFPSVRRRQTRSLSST